VRAARFLTLALLVIVGAVVPAQGWAHGTGSHAGFQARLSYIEPQQPGLLVQVLGGHVRLSVANLTRKTIEIPGADGAPTVRIPPGRTTVWVEPRIGAKEAPPSREGLVRNWEIPGTADGEPFRIVGFLGYRPPQGTTTAAQDDGLPTWVVVLAVLFGVLVLAAALAVPFLRGSENDEGRA
jgi:hypothetical protein